MSSTHLTKITKRAKAIRKAHPNMKWQNAVKQASKALSKPKTKSSHSKPKTKTVMATKKRTHSTRAVTVHRKPRRASVSGHVNKHGITLAGKMVIGGIAGGILATVANRMLPQVNRKALAVGEAVAGIYLAASQAKHPIIQGVGIGIATAGGTSLAMQMGVIHGIEDAVAGIGEMMSPTPSRLIDHSASDGVAGNEEGGLGWRYDNSGYNAGRDAMAATARVYDEHSYEHGNMPLGGD